MAENPLFYKSTLPLNRDQHRDLKLRVPERQYGYAASSHIIPALAEEFGVAARHLPIVFLLGTSLPTAVFLVGLRPGRNDFVNAAGAWTAGYIPAFVRRYPFIIGEAAGSEPLICIDQTFEGLDNDSGEPLFDQDGKEAPVLIDKIKFSNEYFRAAKVTETLAKRIQELNLLRPISVEVKGGAADSAVIHGIFAIDEAKLAALTDEQFLALRKDGLLAPIYAHLMSLSAVDRLGTEGKA